MADAPYAPVDQCYGRGNAAHLNEQSCEWRAEGNPRIYPRSVQGGMIAQLENKMTVRN